MAPERKDRRLGDLRPRTGLPPTSSVRAASPSTATFLPSRRPGGHFARDPWSSSATTVVCQLQPQRRRPAGPCECGMFCHECLLSI